MKNCSNLFFLSTIACQLGECLTEEELTVLAADLVVLSDMLANLVARRADNCSGKASGEFACPRECEDTAPGSSQFPE